MKKHLASLPSDLLARGYRKLGINIDHLLVDIEKFELVEDKFGLRRWEPPVHGDEEFYEQLSKKSWYYMADKEEFKLAREIIGRASVLEVGCGPGFFADHSDFSSYVGLELNGNAANRARTKGHNVIEQMLNEYADSNPSSVDCVCSFQVLEHLPNPKDYFIAALKALKPGGRIITSVPSEDSFVGAIFDNILNAPPHHLTRWTDRALKEFPLSLGAYCLDIHHIPVEKQHQKWFWHQILRHGMVSGCSYDEAKQTPLAVKLKIKFAMASLAAIGLKFTVPNNFCIPGHTLIAVHKNVLD